MDPRSSQLPKELLTLSNLISENPATFASGSNEVQLAALEATKFVFDLALKSELCSRPPIVELVSALTSIEAPLTRSQARANGKRKRSPSPPPTTKPILTPTPLSALFIDGMDENQIWEQLDVRAKTVCETLEEVLDGTWNNEEEESDSEEGRMLKKAMMMNHLNDNEEEMDLDGLMEEMDTYCEDDDDEDVEDEDDDDDDDDKSDFGDGEGDVFGESVEILRDPLSDEDYDDDIQDPSSLLDVHSRKTSIFKGHKASELDDDFFNLASFNAETEEAEALNVSKGSLGGVEEDDSDLDEQSVDLFAPFNDSENFDEEDLERDTGEAYYKDFFEPPPRQPISNLKHRPVSAKISGKVRFHDEVRVKTIKAKGKGNPVSTMDLLSDEDDGEDHGEGTIFDLEEHSGDDSDEDENGASGVLGGREDATDEFGGFDKNELSDAGESFGRINDDLFAEDEGPANDLSTHEKRMAALHEQITALEAENVGKKEWVLMGEANSRARPQNSLLEEDLEFERAMKAVPVVTEEAVLGLEEMIKARISEGRFDDVVRLKPMDNKPFLPSRFFVLQDQKSKQSLAQIYEDEYTMAQTGAVAGEDRDGKLKKEHEQIEKLWEGICDKLDALCNAHFVPKQPRAIISTISNVSTATLESALPSSKSNSTMLAPEEIFAPTPSDPRARSEMTPTEKRALRNKEKKSKKRNRDALDKVVDKYAKKRGMGALKKQKQLALESIVKHGKGVTVVGKKGRDSSGKMRKSR